MSQITFVPAPDATPTVDSTQPTTDAHNPGFHLLVESLESLESLEGGAGARSGVELPVLEVPPGVSHLVPTRTPLTLVTRKPRPAAFMLETIAVGKASGRSRLLLVTPPGLRARLNGQTVPVVALLEVGDQLQLDASAILHVTEYRRGGVEAPSPDLIGRPCGICKLPITADTTVYTCVGCSLPLHLEDSTKPEEERLECALFGDCPSCGTEVKTSSGHVWMPEI